MKVLVLNCGSSSLKFQLIETDEAMARDGRDRTLAKGLVEDAGGTAVLHYEAEGKKPVRDAIGAFQHRTAVEQALAVMTDPENGVIPHKDEIGAVGHRVVHGGERFQSSVLIDEEVIEGIEANIALAPLHNPANLQGYQAAKAVLPDAAAGGGVRHRVPPHHAGGGLSLRAPLQPLPALRHAAVRLPRHLAPLRLRAARRAAGPRRGTPGCG